MPSVLSNTNGLLPIWLPSPLITLMNGVAKPLIKPSYYMTVSLERYGERKTQDDT